ncbi:MAG: zeta toxin family protein [Candidatus Riflebacteria bacterium]|nr:zeta toxin family protein [Candidatus Riflebacteria bacterium]
MIKKPLFVIIAGPNGAGKTTCAKRLIPSDVPFINADEIANGLPLEIGINPDMAASRALLKAMSECEATRASFAIETTLASKTLTAKIRHFQKAGYHVQMIFLWLSSVDLAIDRVMERVRRGGHSIPATTIRRRYASGIKNFFELYKNLPDSWRFFDNSILGEPRLLATGTATELAPEHIILSDLWNTILEGIRRG